MIKTNSIYTLNKKDPNAIVYNTSFGAACPERTAKNTKRQGANALAFGHTDFVKLPSELNRRDKKAASSLCPFSPPRIF